MSIAILVNGGFFIKRHSATYGRSTFPKDVVRNLISMSYAHLKYLNDPNKDPSRRSKVLELYRIFYYDCDPYLQKGHNPINKIAIDFSKTPEAKFRQEFYQELRKQRRVALRLGYLKGGPGWVISPQKTKELLNGKITVSDLRERDVHFDLKQKGVDIKIGLDIASLSYKKQVKKIILVSGDSDFVPAAKLARREGIDFILDPMWNPIDLKLHEHIDGLNSMCPRPVSYR